MEPLYYLFHEDTMINRSTNRAEFINSSVEIFYDFRIPMRDIEFEKFVERAEGYPHHLCPMNELVNYNFKIMFTYYQGVTHDCICG